MIPPSYISLEEALRKREDLRQNAQSLVITNGCFDLLHTGHVFSLMQAAALGDQLWVLLNSDLSVRKIKGSARPIINERERSFMLKSLSCVNEVILFENENVVEEIKCLKPNQYVKSSDYNLDSVNQDERKALEDCNAKINFVETLPGLSTTNLLKRIKLSTYGE